VDDAVTLDALAGLDRSRRDARLLPPDVLLADWPLVALPDDEAGRFLTGLRRRVAARCARVRVYAPQPRFLGPAHITARRTDSRPPTHPAEVHRRPPAEPHRSPEEAP
jgi:tRNA pseudouridine55 synthase